MMLNLERYLSGEDIFELNIFENTNILMLKEQYKLEGSDAFKIFFECDNDILLCIANSYKFDNRFKQYINKFSNKDLSDFIYQAIKIYCNKNQSV